MTPNKPLYLPDFITGIFAALAEKGVPALSLRQSRLDLAFAKLSQDLIEEAGKSGLDVRFRIRVHPVHQDSTALQQALYEAAQRDLISLDNPEFQRVRLKITSAEAPSYFARLPGTRELYLGLADRLLAYYQSPSDEAESPKTQPVGG